ncbi:unnamed protein product [Acanthoscelides obtectus]|uniref:BESS domain-containing protein n=1 Tax=Acanthoscelides obtectus TaxID=200917 RepID=A0A9P0JPB6_ACAOB|nr:unnamed protein product [Acanthoscelides obtectus]CAK1642917.1 hypothetical protein AOBTE_LOCUS13292 [Acanthoscelides obtectus]
MTTSNFTEENHTIEEASDHEQNEYVTPLRPIHVQKKRKVASETDHNNEIVGLLKANLAQQQTNDIMLDNDGDRHFLLSLLPDFRRVPIDKKMDVKLAMIQSIKSALLPNLHLITTMYNICRFIHPLLIPLLHNIFLFISHHLHKCTFMVILLPLILIYLPIRHPTLHSLSYNVHPMKEQTLFPSSHPIPLNQLQQTDPSSIFLLITKAKTKIVELIINYYFSCTTLNTNRFRKKTSISIFSLP